MHCQDLMEKRVMEFCRSLYSGLSLGEMHLARCVLGEEIAKREIFREVMRKSYFVGFEEFDISGLCRLELKARLSLRGYDGNTANPKAWQIEGFDDTLEGELDHWFEVFECDGPPADAKWEMEGAPSRIDTEPEKPPFAATGITKVYFYWTPPETPLNGRYLVLVPDELRATRRVYENGVMANGDDSGGLVRREIVVAKER